MAALPGLRWKVWFIDEAAGEAGGIALFDDEAVRQAYMEGALSAQRSARSIRDLTYKLSDVLAEHSAITRGPIGSGVRV
jgi:hypothetical protein